MATRRFVITCVNCNEKGLSFRATGKYCNVKCQMRYEYRTGTRSGQATTKAAHDAVRGRKFPNRKRPHFTAESLKRKGVRISAAKQGRQVPRLQGENHWNWRGGVSKDLWKSPDYQQWRRAVFRRDGYRCVLCGSSESGKLQADHVKPRFWFPELVFDVSNGRTLCVSCHKATPTYGHKVKMLNRDLL